MRVARAAAARDEADDCVAFGRSPRYNFSKTRTRGSSPNHRSSRATVRLSAEPDAWEPPRQATPAPKQKRVRKGSAVKRSRVHMSVAAARGPAGGQRDADSRFPMPYPGVDRAPTQSQHHHLGQRRFRNRAVADLSTSRRTQNIEDRNHRSAVRRLGTRPRSAMVLPLSQTGGPGSGRTNGQRQPPKPKRKQEVSKAARVGEQDQRRGGKRSRPASAPPARSVLEHHEETRGKDRSEAGVLLALSRMADGSSCAPSELRIMKWVVLRETYLTKLHGVVSADRKRAKSDRKRPSPKLFAILTELLTVLRRITVEIVEAVEKWRRRDKARPFIWGSSNYLVKAAGDVEFLSRLPGLEQHLGVVVADNPFLVQTGLGGRSTVLDRSSIRSRSGQFPLGASESFGVSAERVAAASAVLYREVQRARRERGRGRGRERGRREESNSCSDEPPRVDRSPLSTRHRPASSLGRRSPEGSGSDRRSGRSRDRNSRSRHGERQTRPRQSPGAAAAADASCRALSPLGDDDRTLDYRNGVRHRESRHRREEQIVSEKDTAHLGGDGGRVCQPARRRSSIPEPTELGNGFRRSQEASRSEDINLVAAGDRPVSEERNFDGRRRDSSSSQHARRRSSAASELTEPGWDNGFTQQAPRRSLPYRSLAPGGDPRNEPRTSGQFVEGGEPAHRDNRRATEVWHTRNNLTDGGRRRSSQYQRRRSTGSGDSRHAKREARPSLPYYAAVVEDNHDESRVLPPDDQSLDYQNGGVAYRDEYCYEQQDGGVAYYDDEQNLDYYYEQQEGGYDAYAEVEPQTGYGAGGITAEDERFTSRGNPDGDPAVDPDPAERRPSNAGTYTDYGPATATAPEDGAAAPEDGAAVDNDASAPPTDDMANAGELTVVQPTEALPAVAEETKSTDGPDPQDGNHGRMGRRGSPFNLIFNMCDGMLTDLKGLGDRPNVSEDRSNLGEDDTYHFEPMLLGDLAGMGDRNGGLATSATAGTGDNHADGGTCVPLAQADAEQNMVAREGVGGGGQADIPPPKLRGATYASLTRDIVAMSKEGSPKRKGGSSGGDERSGVETSNRVLTEAFLAWAERTEGRLRHRDAKAARHHRLRQLRRSMSAWEAHRAKFLGGRMADAFAGRFALSSRFFVRFAFDALRTHAKGARVAARNRTAMGKFVSHLERFGRARLRQAWRRWAPPKLGTEYWGAEHGEALKKLCRHWGRGRLRGAWATWRQPEPTLHTAGSFAVLKGKLKAAGSFANLKAAPTTKRSLQATAVSQGTRPQEKPPAASKANSEEEDSWAAWLGNEASISVVSPDGEKGSLRAAPETKGVAASNSDNRMAGGEQALSPSRSFRGLGAALKSMKSFRDGRDKSQAQRPGLRPTASFGASPRSSASPPALAPPSSPSPAASSAAMEAVDALQTKYFAANRTKLRGEAARLRSRELAAATIQRALWRAPRERRVASRVSNSVLLVQRMVKLRGQRIRAGFKLVRAWRGRVRARIATLDRALVEAAGEGDLRAVAFLLRPAVAAGMKQGAGVGVCKGLGGADANATAGAEGETALHAAASAGSRSGRPHASATTVTGGRDKDAGRSGASTAVPMAPAVSSSSGAGNRGGLSHKNERYSGENWLRGQEKSPNWVGVIQALVQAGAMMEARDRRGFTPMMTAAVEGTRETVTILATLGAELDNKEVRGGKRTPLVLAAQEANAQAAAALLEYGAKANLTVGDGLTPLHEAVGAGSIAVSEMLVRAGANVNATSETGGMTPLHLAVANGQHAAARLLVHSGANVCLPDSRGLTCLRLTVEMADAPTVALLLAAEPPADLSVKDENGGTVLHAACRLGLTDIAKLLLEHGADPHVRDARGRTAELVALDLGHVDCAGLFYNMDIHSYTPNRTDRGGSSDDDEPGAGDRRNRGRGENRGEEEEHDDDGDGDADGDGDPGNFSLERDGETGIARRTSASLRQGFDEAVAAARRASSLSVQQAESELRADPRRQRASASSFASGEGAAPEDESEEGQREGQHAEGYSGGYAERGEHAEQHAESYDDEGNADAEGERADWEWSETEGWVRGGGGGGAEPAGTQVLDGEQQDTTAASKHFGKDEGYEGYKGPRESESYSDWQQPYYPTAQGDSHGESYDGTVQEEQQQQVYSGHGGNGSYGAARGVGNDNNGQQDHRNAGSFERASWQGPASWEGSGRGDHAELLQETGVAAGGHDHRDLFEAALGEGWAPANDPGWEKADDAGRSAGAAANHDSATGSDSDDHDSDDREQESAAATTDRGNSEGGSGRDAYSSSGWGSAAAVAKASNRWMSLVDRSSGNVYYQNEHSGQTEWDVPEGAVVVSAAPEDT